MNIEYHVIVHVRSPMLYTGQSVKVLALMCKSPEEVLKTYMDEVESKYADVFDVRKVIAILDHQGEDILNVL